MKKIIFKTIKAIVIIEIVCLCVYTILHETGHAIMTLLMGGEIKQISLFPQAFVKGSLPIPEKPMARIFIGLAGIVFPFIIAIIINFIKTKRFKTWLFNLSLKFISLVNFISSIVILFMYQIGHVIEKDDIVQVAKHNPEGIVFYYTLLAVLSIITMIDIAKMKPVSRVLDYYEN